MLYDHRTYVCRPGTLKPHLELYERYGWAPQRRHLGEPVFYAITETGVVNSYVHVWAYADAADRAAKRAAMLADADWQTYLQKSAEAGYLVSQVNQLMTPTGFFSALKS
ncbi:MAG: NIPSNAP family protein [Pseudomonadota bacterium]